MLTLCEPYSADRTVASETAARSELLSGAHLPPRRAAVRAGRPDVGLAAVVAAPVREESQAAPAEAPNEQATGPFGAVGDSPIEVREKVHPSEPMTLAEAVNRMELVGHDFYLFNDADTGRASVVYRRRGWSYGVIHLEPAVAHDTQASG